MSATIDYKPGILSSVACAHEAGHAVVALTHNVTVTKLWAAPDAFRGSCSYSSEFGTLDPEKRITITLGGVAGQEAAGYPSSIYHTSWDADFEAIKAELHRGLAIDATSGEALQIIHNLKAVAERTLRMHASLFERIRSELSYHGTLDTEGVGRVVRLVNREQELNHV